MSRIHFGHLKGWASVNALLVERRDEGLIELRHDGVSCRRRALNVRFPTINEQLKELDLAGDQANQIADPRFSSLFAKTIAERYHEPGWLAKRPAASPAESFGNRLIPG
jgi:hypothetical protein